MIKLGKLIITTARTQEEREIRYFNKGLQAGHSLGMMQAQVIYAQLCTQEDDAGTADRLLRDIGMEG